MTNLPQSKINSIKEKDSMYIYIYKQHPQIKISIVWIKTIYFEKKIRLLYTYFLPQQRKYVPNWFKKLSLKIMFLSPPKKRRPKLNTIICPSQLICVPPRIPKEHLKTNKTYDIAWLSFYLVVSFFLLEGFYEFLLFSSLPNHLFCRNHTHLFSVAQSRSWGKAERPQHTPVVHTFQTLKHHRRKRLETEFGWMILKRLKMS